MSDGPSSENHQAAANSPSLLSALAARRALWAALILLALCAGGAALLLRPVRASRPSGTTAPRTAASGVAPQDYLVYAVCESADRVAIVRFGPQGASLARTVNVSYMPGDISGPHGFAFSPDRNFYYVSLGHGRPYGNAVKYAAKDDAVLGRVLLGLFPATEDVTPDGNFLYVVNFNLHGDMVPSSVSVVETGSMLEVARIPTCVMPHGSRINSQGTRQYSACMMDDMLVEIDTTRMKVSRYFRLTAGKEMGMTGSPATSRQAVAPMTAAQMAQQVTCSPTWAQPSSSGDFVYVACNKSSQILEIATAGWKITRRFAAGLGVYNLAVTKDGTRLIATNKRAQSASVFDLHAGKELARLPTKRTVVHGAVASPDSRYAFITVEGVGSQPGTVEVIDLNALKTVASVDTPPQAAGIDFYKMEPPASPSASASPR